MASGRTDKDVSALSQIISFHTFDKNITVDSIYTLFSESEASFIGRLKLFQCVRVPRKFHALFLATWYSTREKSYSIETAVNVRYLQEAVHLSFATAKGFSC